MFSGGMLSTTISQDRLTTSLWPAKDDPKQIVCLELAIYYVMLHPDSYLYLFSFLFFSICVHVQDRKILRACRLDILSKVTKLLLLEISKILTKVHPPDSGPQN